ncbi:MAG: hypothetical protein PHQ91_15585 [Thermoanaerobaculaceae bacterium]|nr:hypothetical protein [Thermoanaerobaculaceae bacterium]
MHTTRSISAGLGPAILLACAATAGITGIATAQDQVSGTFTVNGTSTALAYAYAYWKPNFFDETKKDLFVLFSDVALPANAIPKDDDGVSAIAGLVRDGKVHALELHLDPRSRQLDAAENAAVYHMALSPGRHGMSGMHAFTATTFTTSLLEGTAHTDGPQESDGVKWQYDVRFKVALPPQ